MKTILLHIYDDLGLHSRLQVALDIARAHHAHISCLQGVTQITPMTFGPMGGEYVAAVNLDDLREEEHRLRETIEAQLKKEDVSWDWKVDLGDPATILIENSGLMDLVVLSQSVSKRPEPNEPLPLGGEIAVHAHSAAMIVPTELKSFDSDAPLVIGWNGSGEAARAIRLALPMLKKAEAVHLVSIGEKMDEFPQTDASAYLARHGIESEIHQISNKKKSASEQLEEFAYERSAAAIIMGAYGHSRLRETLFGGVTHDLLKQSRIPLIMGH